MPYYRKCLTVEEIQGVLDDLEQEEQIVDDVEVVIVPPDPDDVTDEEEIGENDLTQSEIQDVAGTLEIFVGAEGVAANEENLLSPSESSTSKKRKTCFEKSTSCKKQVESQGTVEPKWVKCDAKYNTDSSNCEIANNLDSLRGKSEVDIFEEFLSEKILELVINQSEIYANQKNRPGFCISKEELKAFIGILLISGYHKLPQEDMYWEQAPDVGVPSVYKTMPKNRFREIKKFLHLNDNSKIDKSDKMFKLRLFFDTVREEFLKFEIFHGELSLDEMMVRYYGRHSAKMFMRGKPIKFGYKIWCLCSSNGYLYNFSPYCGKTDTEGPLGLRVISELTSVIPADRRPQINLFFDNFFTSIDALTALKAKNIKATGTMRENRTKKCPVMSNKDIEKKEERGFCDFRFDTTNEILIMKWKDNKVVTVGTNFSTVEPFANARRYSQREKKQIQIPIPKAIQEYNVHMGGVDLLDKQISLYRIRIRSKKWWWPLFTQMIDIMVVNAWRTYQAVNPEENVSLLDVRRKIVLVYLNKKTDSTPKRRGPQGSKFLGGRVSVEVRFDAGNHLIQYPRRGDVPYVKKNIQNMYEM